MNTREVGSAGRGIFSPASDLVSGELAYEMTFCLRISYADRSTMYARFTALLKTVDLEEELGDETDCPPVSRD